MSADLAARIASAREAAAKATPGPWEEGGPWPSISVIYQTDPGCSYGPDGGQPPEYDMVCSVWQGVGHTGRMLPEHPDRDRLLADARVIVLAVNSFTALLDVAEAGKAFRSAETIAAWVAAGDVLDAALAKVKEVL